MLHDRNKMIFFSMYLVYSERCPQILERILFHVEEISTDTA